MKQWDAWTSHECEVHPYCPGRKSNKKYKVRGHSCVLYQLFTELLNPSNVFWIRIDFRKWISCNLVGCEIPFYDWEFHGLFILMHGICGFHFMINIALQNPKIITNGPLIVQCIVLSWRKMSVTGYVSVIMIRIYESYVALQLFYFIIYCDHCCHNSPNFTSHAKFMWGTMFLSIMFSDAYVLWLAVYKIQCNLWTNLCMVTIRLTQNHSKYCYIQWRIHLRRD